MDLNIETYDQLLDSEVIVDVEFGNTLINVKDFLNLHKDDVLALDKKSGRGADIYVNSRAIGIGDIIVIDDKFAVRIQEVVDEDTVVQYFYKEALI